MLLDCHFLKDLQQKKLSYPILSMYQELGHQYQIPLFTDILERIWDKRLEINPDLQNKYIKT